MFDWAAPEVWLHRISMKQIAQFLIGHDKDDVYGFGFFCDAYYGTVLLVANTEQYHLSSLRDFEGRFGPTDEEVYRWEIGNWKYPAGLFPSSSPEQREYDAAWKEYQEPLVLLEQDDKQAILERACLNVLRTLVDEGTFSTVLGMTGVTTLGPDDPQEIVLEKRKHLDRIFGL